MKHACEHHITDVRAAIRALTSITLDPNTPFEVIDVTQVALPVLMAYLGRLDGIAPRLAASIQAIQQADGQR